MVAIMLSNGARKYEIELKSRDRENCLGFLGFWGRKLEGSGVV